MTETNICGRLKYNFMAKSADYFKLAMRHMRLEKINVAVTNHAAR